MSQKRNEKIVDFGEVEASRKRLKSLDDVEVENKYDLVNLDFDNQSDVSGHGSSDYEDTGLGNEDKYQSGFDSSGIGGEVITFSDESAEEEEAVLEELVFGSRKRSTKVDHEEPIGFFIDKTSGGAVEKPAAVWVDEDDEEEEVGVRDVESRGMGNMRAQPLIKGNRKMEFEKAVGEAPSWSVLPDAESKSHDQLELLKSTFRYISDSERLPRGILDFHCCTDMNKQQHTRGPLSVCEFHKTAQIGMTGGRDCRLNLFQVDGKENPKIHSFFIERFPIKCAHFLASGEEIVITSRPRFFYSYDLISGQITEVRHIKGTGDQNMNKFYVSPDRSHLLFLSSFGHINLVSAKTKELIKTVKVNGCVRDVVFRKQGQEFLAFGEEGVVTIWDIRSQSCFHSFVDEGCTYGTSVTASSNGQYVACGSKSGIVNFYDEACFSQKNPHPVKVFKNLQYSTNCLQFNSSSEILGMTSDEADNAVRLIHVPSQTVFSNFPGLSIKYLRQIKAIDFSPSGGYMMLGNNRGRAFLFRLDHYKSY